MLAAIAFFVVALTGAFPIALGGAALFKPSLASKFLLGFASTPAKHYSELAVRFFVGFALVIHAGATAALLAFNIFGALLIATTSFMALLPWRKHQAFASRAVPSALRYLPLIGAASIAGGVAILFFAANPSAA